MRVPHSQLRETVSVEDFAGSGSHGPVYAAARSVRASMQPTSRLLIEDNGREVTVTVLGIIRPEAGPVPVQSRVTWAGVVYRVATSIPMPDTRRPDHWEIGLVRYAG